MVVVFTAASLFGRATKRVRQPWFWRLLYRLLDTRAAVHAAAGLVRLVGRVQGPEVADALLASLSELFVWSGWPHQQRTWVNLDASRFLTRVRRHDAAELDRPQRRRPQTTPVRIGCIGPFARLPTFAPGHLLGRPDAIALTLFDVGFDDRHATYLAETADDYVVVDSSAPARTARAIDGAELDLLIVAWRDFPVHGVLDRLDVPCVVNVCTGSDLLHHERVDFHLYAQSEPDYFAVGNRVFCGTTATWFGPAVVVPVPFLYDGRDLDPTARVSAEDRERLIVVHGSLFKAATPPFLGQVMSLLAEDRELELVLFGREDEDSLQTIRAAAVRAGVAARLTYAGGFEPVRTGDGSPDAGWTAVAAALGRARLAPDPWPLGGGASRVEAFGAGAPSVHLGVRFDRGSWGRGQHSVAELEALRVADAIAWSPAEYGALCRRVLYDDEFANGIADTQAVLFDSVTDAAAFWQRLLDLHDRWARGALA